MFSHSGYFLAFKCPFYEGEGCHRVNCLFKHENKDGFGLSSKKLCRQISVEKGKSFKNLPMAVIPQYIPTPRRLLESMKMEAVERVTLADVSEAELGAYSPLQMNDEPDCLASGGTSFGKVGVVCHSLPSLAPVSSALVMSHHSYDAYEKNKSKCSPTSATQFFKNSTFSATTAQNILKTTLTTSITTTTTTTNNSATNSSTKNTLVTTTTTLSTSTLPTIAKTTFKNAAPCIASNASPEEAISSNIKKHIKDKNNQHSEKHISTAETENATISSAPVSSNDDASTISKNATSKIGNQVSAKVKNTNKRKKESNSEEFRTENKSKKEANTGKNKTENKTEKMKITTKNNKNKKNETKKPSSLHGVVKKSAQSKEMVTKDVSDQVMKKVSLAVSTSNNSKKEAEEDDDAEDDDEEEDDEDDDDEDDDEMRSQLKVDDAKWQLVKRLYKENERARKKEFMKKLIKELNNKNNKDTNNNNNTNKQEEEKDKGDKTDASKGCAERKRLAHRACLPDRPMPKKAKVLASPHEVMLQRYREAAHSLNNSGSTQSASTANPHKAPTLSNKSQHITKVTNLATTTATTGKTSSHLTSATTRVATSRDALTTSHSITASHNTSKASRATSTTTASVARGSAIQAYGGGFGSGLQKAVFVKNNKEYDFKLTKNTNISSRHINNTKNSINNNTTKNSSINNTNNITNIAKNSINTSNTNGSISLRGPSDGGGGGGGRQMSKFGAFTGSDRVAHHPAKVIMNRPIPNNLAQCQIPLNTRQAALNKLVDLCSGIYDNSQDAITRALSEEESMASNCTKSAYLSRCSSCLMRMKREMESPGEGSNKQDFTVVKGIRNPSFKDITLTEASFYKGLQAYLLTQQQLKDNGFPHRHEDKVVICRTSNSKKASHNALEKVCSRCGTTFYLASDGTYPLHQPCHYHWAKPFKKKVYGSVELVYNCCNADSSSRGCDSAECHVHDDNRETALLGFVDTLPPLKPHLPQHGVFAIDCEMVYTTAGSELARVTVVDWRGEVLLDKLVKPDNPVIDYNTRFSGLRQEHLQGVETDQRKVQALLLSIINKQSILLGHSLENDLISLKLMHACVVDTSVVFPHKLGPPYKRALRTLASELLQRIIQDSDGHDSKEDAVTCVHLMSLKVRQDIAATLRSY